MIDVSSLTKRYGSVTAVNELSFHVKPGIVTGFLGPNGAGKTTTMRMILGLDRPTAGQALIDGKPYRSLPRPLTKVGAVVSAKAFHPKRSARNHLRWLAASNGISSSRVDEVLALVGLSEVARKNAGGFSLGMSQRLGIAGALLGDPEVLVLDEPVNGLDPEGIHWMRTLLKSLAAEGRTILVSSHLLSEMAQTADRVVVIGKGELIADTSVDEFVAMAAGTTTIVRTPQQDQLSDALRSEGIAFTADLDKQGRPRLIITNQTTEDIGALAFGAGITLHELSAQTASLEEAFMQQTSDKVEYHTGTPGEKGNK